MAAPDTQGGMGESLFLWTFLQLPVLRSGSLKALAVTGRTLVQVGDHIPGRMKWNSQVIPSAEEAEAREKKKENV